MSLANRLTSPISSRYAENTIRRNLRFELERSGFAYLPRFLKHSSLKRLTEIIDALKNSMRRRDFDMEGWETPRRMSVASGATAAAAFPELIEMYGSKSLFEFVESIVQHTVFACQNPHEFLVVNSLSRQGDTHGWHLDDPPYALVFSIQTPTLDEGGWVEIIRKAPPQSIVDPELKWPELRQFIEESVKSGNVSRHYLRNGDAYLLQSSRYIHRVSELTAPSLRTVLNMAFCVDDHSKTNRTAAALYALPDEDLKDIQHALTNLHYECAES